MTDSPISNARVRVAYLTGEYPAVSHTFILREVEALRAAGRDVLTCSIRRTGPEHHRGPGEREAARTTFHVLDTAKRPGPLLAALGAALARPGRLARAARLAWTMRAPGWRAALWQVFYLVEAIVLAHHLTQSGAGRIHNHFAGPSCTVAMLAGLLADLPFGFTLHGPADFEDPLRWRLDLKIARADLVACISHFARSQGMIRSDPAHWSRLRIVHCGVSPDRYATAGARGGARLLFVGRLAAVKGVPVLLDAMSALKETHPDAHLTLVGDGPERARIEARAAALGLGAAVTFAGYRSQDEVAAELARTDVFALPSFAEGVPVVLMEAMAAGLPVLTTRIAGISELVEDGVSGRLVPPGDVATLTGALDDLLSDANLRQEMGRAGRAAVAAEFDIAREAAWLDRLMDDPLSDRPGR